ncbi:tyrosine-type recombinase/integrase [Pseudomonas sp. OV226]|uniref:tyrosine-type recombinase/integrase n=1 Tax=Pseudomonas sp. OV226 TaxID=2135588 RepID=UPI000D6D60F0|nr:integrase arm-type DNA-binding domain-containing protein [Pseudomonas sp. OV226]PWK32562.1 integrase [Pseudomonas sp. OV226]
MAKNVLSTKELDRLIRARKPGRFGDGGGLYLNVNASGAASWLFRYKLGKAKTRIMGLGSYPGVSLADARIKAEAQAKLLASKIDPLDQRDATLQAEALAEASRATFKALAIEYQTAHGASWSEKWRKGWLRKLELYAFPHIGLLSAAEIGTGQVLKVLQPIWSSKTRTADEVRGQVEAILDAAKSRGLREGDNPARWRSHLDNLLSKTDKRKARQRRHFAAMSWAKVPELMQQLVQIDSFVAVATQLMILTGARAQMIRFAAWDEFDLEAGVWSLPADRMKMRKAFAIPLAAEVVVLLQQLPRIERNPYLFPGQRLAGGRQATVIHANAIRNLLHRMGRDDVTRHGFRSSFRDWANECTNYPREVCELSLAHDERDQTEAAYSRSDFLEKRRALMADWASYCTRTPATNVVRMREAKV